MVSYISALQSEVCGGFDFSNFQRNELLQRIQGNSTSSIASRFTKTGTTICGVLCGSNGIVLGTDTRATSGHVVSEKNCQKLHILCDNITAAGAGIAADLDHTTKWISAKLKLDALNSKSQPRVKHAVTVLADDLFKYQGHRGCALIIGGVDCTGGSLYQIAPNGAVTSDVFMSMGSGSLHAITVLENGYKPNLTIEEGLALIAKAVSYGIMNDMGSGSNVDLCSITKEGMKLERSIPELSISKLRQPKKLYYDIGTTKILRESIEELKKNISVVEEDVEMENM